MKSFLLSSALLFSVFACSAEYEQTQKSKVEIEPKVAVEAPLVFPPLVDRLPAETLLLVSVSDFSEIQSLGSQSCLGRTWGHPELRDFFATAEVECGELWMALKDKSSELALDPSLLDWGAYENICFAHVDSPQPHSFIEWTLISKEKASLFFDFVSKIEARGELGDNIGVQLIDNRVEIVIGESGELLEPLSSLKCFRADWRLSQQSGAPVIVWANASALASRRASGMEQVGGSFSALDSLYIFSGWNDKGSSVADLSLRYKEGASPTWVKYFGKFNPELLKYIPEKSDVALVGDFDLSGVFQEYVLGKLPEETDLDLEVLFAGLGSQYWGWSRTKGLMPSGYFAFEVSNMDVFQTEFEKGMRLVLNDPNNIDQTTGKAFIRGKRMKLRVKDESGKMVDKAGSPYFTYQGLGGSLPSLGSLPITLEPTLALHPDGWLIFGWDVPSIKAALRKPIRPLADNILNVDDASQFFTSIPRDSNFALWENWRPQIEQAMSLAQMGVGALSMAASGQDGGSALLRDLPFDLEKIPNLSLLAKDLQPAHTLMVFDEDRLWLNYQSNFAIADLALIAGFLINAGPLGIKLVEQSTGEPFPLFNPLDSDSELEF